MDLEPLSVTVCFWERFTGEGVSVCGLVSVREGVYVCLCK